MAEETKKPEDKKDDKSQTPQKETLTVSQLRDVFMNDCKHTNGQLSKQEEDIIKRMIALIKTPEGNGFRNRGYLEEVKRWVPVGHDMNATISMAIMEAKNM